MKQAVDVDDLKVGMYVSELDRPWLETPFLFQGFPIQSQADIEQLRQWCRHVYVDMEQSQVEPGRRDDSGHRFDTGRVNVTPGVPPKEEGGQDEQALRGELREARQVYAAARSYVGKLLRDVRLGHSIETETARGLVNQMVGRIVRNESALVWLTLLKHRDEYTALHSINVCILSLVFGRHLGLSGEDLAELGLGALLHDIGKMRVPLALLNKTSKLSPQELLQLQEHAAHGYRILSEKPQFPARALDVVHSHHERIDGGGYPRGLSGTQVSRFAIIVSIVDVYDAVTSARAYHSGISPHEALNLMYGWGARTFPAQELQEFIKCLGIYPIGSIVELETGEVGVVMTVNRRHHLRPVVLLLLDSDKAPYVVRRLLNLEAMARAGHPRNIRRILQSDAYGIDVRRVILQGDDFGQVETEEESHERC